MIIGGPTAADFVLRPLRRSPMDLGLIIVVLHVLIAGWFVSGLIGRGVSFRYARSSDTIETTAALLRVSEHFELRMVMPGSMAVLLLGLFAAWLRGWPILGFLEGSPINWLLVSLILYLSLVPFIPLYLAPMRKRRGLVVEAALAKGMITHELTAALDDKGVRAYRMAELIIVVIVTVLMIAKPF
jgi:hypothetical protein